MSLSRTYITIKGIRLDLSGLDADEIRLVRRLKQRARALADWDAFDNYWIAAVAAFYDARGLPRPESRKTVPYLIAQDLSNRIAVQSGLARLPDYRDELEELIRSKFASRKSFCEATGISESLLSHVLHRRKELAIDTLEQALAKIGYQLRIAPRAEPELAGRT
jgi:hypothetical protein